jgi:hypothetical protein
MQTVEQYPWRDVVVGTYVYDATGELWKVVEAHPSRPYTFRCTTAVGDIAVVSLPPEKRVTAIVPDEDEALRALAEILGAKAMEGQFMVEAIAPTGARGGAPRLRSHLKIMHNAYTEPSMKFPEMVRLHNMLHAEYNYLVPHKHRSA